MDIKIQMLKAHEGDCIYLEIPRKEDCFRILIDCGPANCWATMLKTFFEQLKQENKRINALLITHIDSDHIGGAVPLLDSDYAALIDEIWFNGLGQLAKQEDITMEYSNACKKISEKHQHSFGEKQEEISAPECQTLSRSILEKEKKHNSFVDEKVIKQGVTLKVDDEIFIDFILPTDEGLDKLVKKFSDELWDEYYEGVISFTKEASDAFENCLLDAEAGSIRDEDIGGKVINMEKLFEWKLPTKGQDTSKTNSSSLAFCLRYYDKNYLFAGDAIDSDLLHALEVWEIQTGRDLIFEAVKMPHHGAFLNCRKMIEIIKCKNYYFSTDGKKFDHPSKETLAKIIKISTDERPNFVFNYQNDLFNTFACSKYCEKYGYSIEYGN